jgi:hypothetical protein
LIFLNDFSSMTALMKFRKSRTSPTLMSSIIATVRSRTSAQIDFGMYTRLAAEHFCP